MNTDRPVGIHHLPHTHTKFMGIPVRIPIPRAALTSNLQKLSGTATRQLFFLLFHLSTTPPSPIPTITSSHTLTFSFRLSIAAILILTSSGPESSLWAPPAESASKSYPQFSCVEERKGKEEDFYSAYCQYLDHWALRCGSHRVTCKYTTSAFPSYKYSLEGETAANSLFHLANRYTTHFPSHWG